MITARFQSQMENGCENLENDHSDQCTQEIQSQTCTTIVRTGAVPTGAHRDEICAETRFAIFFFHGWEFSLLYGQIFRIQLISSRDFPIVPSLENSWALWPSGWEPFTIMRWSSFSKYDDMDRLNGFLRAKIMWKLFECTEFGGEVAEIHQNSNQTVDTKFWHLPSNSL